MTGKRFWGLTAQFETPQEILKAAEAAHAAGYRKIDAYTPVPVHGLHTALGLKDTKLPLLILCGGLTGAIGGFALEYWAAVIAYPLNIGGKPFNSWPAFVPPAYEITILLSAFTAVFGMLALNGLPRPHHPIFDAPGFEHATRDRFFLSVEAADEKFDRAATRKFLESLHPLEVSEVESDW